MALLIMWTAAKQALSLVPGIGNDPNPVFPHDPDPEMEAGILQSVSLQVYRARPLGAWPLLPYTSHLLQKLHPSQQMTMVFTDMVQESLKHHQGAFPFCISCIPFLPSENCALPQRRLGLLHLEYEQKGSKMGWWNSSLVTNMKKKDFAKAKLFERKGEKEKLLKFKGQTLRELEHDVCLF